MSKLFFTKKSPIVETGYVNNKNFTLINILSLLLLFGAIPIIFILLTSNTPTSILTLLTFLLVIAIYIKLWIGENKQILTIDNQGLVTIYDDDLHSNSIKFNVKEINDLEIKSKSSGYRTGYFGGNTNYINAAQLHITLDNGVLISFGSNTYGGQLKLIKRFLTEKYHSF